MAKIEAKKKHFVAQVRVNLEIGYDIHANNLDEAMEHAKSLKVGDVVDVQGEEYDSEMALTGISQMGVTCSEGLK